MATIDSNNHNNNKTMKKTITTWRNHLPNLRSEKTARKQTENGFKNQATMEDQQPMLKLSVFSQQLMHTNKERKKKTKHDKHGCRETIWKGRKSKNL